MENEPSKSPFGKASGEDQKPVTVTTEKSSAQPIDTQPGQPPVEKLEEEGFPLPKENAKFTDLSTDQMFLALRQRLKRDKAVQMLQNGHTKFLDLMERMGPAYVAELLVKAAAEVGDGQVKAAQIIETE